MLCAIETSSHFFSLSYERCDSKYYFINNNKKHIKVNRENCRVKREMKKKYNTVITTIFQVFPFPDKASTQKEMYGMELSFDFPF